MDLLTCGQCQRVFPLSDICRFVQHKVTGCSKDPLLSNCNSGTGQDDNNGGQPPLDNGLSAAKTKSHQHRSQSPAGADEPPHHQRRPLPSSTPKRSSDRRNNGDDGAGCSSEDEKPASGSTGTSSVPGRVKQGSESSEDLAYKKSNRSASSCVDAESNTTNSGNKGLFFFQLLFFPIYTTYIYVARGINDIEKVTQSVYDKCEKYTNRKVT